MLEMDSMYDGVQGLWEPAATPFPPQDVEHVSPADQVLVAGGRLLSGHQTPESASLSQGSTLHLTSRLCGGVPVKVRCCIFHTA